MRFRELAGVRAVVDRGAFEEAGAVVDGPALGVARRPHHAGHPGVRYRARAHRAGFQGREEVGADEPVVADSPRGRAERDDFGVGGGVGVAQGAVAAFADDFAVEDDHGTDGDFACGGGGAGEFEGAPHVGVVGSGGHALAFRGGRGHVKRHGGWRQE